jgi:DNA-binding MarR family transcriptional regulator
LRASLNWTTFFVNRNMAAAPFATRRRAAARTEALPMPARKRAKTSRTAAPLRRGAPQIGLAELNGRLGYFVRRIQVWIFQDFIRTLARVDISPAQYSVLVVIDANPGLSQAELAVALGIERARLVRLLHRLERRNLTQRLASSADARAHALRLTREGERTLSQASALAKRHESRVRKKLGAENYRVLIETLRAF